MLKEAYRNQAELETSLNLAKSNLQLVQSNNEMLEEALRRDSGSAKDVGWRRSSRREPEQREHRSEDNSRNSDYSYQRAEASPSAVLSPPVSARSALSLFSAPSSATIPPTPATGQESGFFKIRFSNGSLTRPGTPNVLSPAVNNYASLASPSMPTLPSHSNKEVEDLTAELQREREAHQKVVQQKVDLESELESLSQALFEEVSQPVPFISLCHSNMPLRFAGEQNGAYGAYSKGRNRRRTTGSAAREGGAQECSSGCGERERSFAPGTLRNRE